MRPRRGILESDDILAKDTRNNLQRMMQEIPLREEERAAVEDGLAALEKLETKLVDIPTPAGPTPREIRKNVTELPIIQQAFTRIDEKSLGRESRFAPLRIATRGLGVNRIQLALSEAAERSHSEQIMVRMLDKRAR